MSDVFTWGVLGAFAVVVLALGRIALKDVQARNAKAEQERVRVETEQSLQALLQTLRDMEKAGSGVVKELHPLDKLSRGAVLGEERGLITIEWVRGKMFVGLTRTAKRAESERA